MMRFIKIVGYMIPVLLVSGVITMPFYWLINRLNNDAEDGTNRWTEAGFMTGCLMSIANILILALYLVILVFSARGILGLLDQFVSRM